jgi:hypothetical protein
MAIPDALALTRPNEAPLNSCRQQELGKGPDFGLSLWKVAAD